MNKFNRWLYRPLCLAVLIAVLTAFTLNYTYGLAETETCKNEFSSNVIDIKVTKKWVGSGPHPSSVYAQLYCNGTPYSDAPVELNASRDWTYTWTVPDLEGCEWSVKEINGPSRYDTAVTGSATEGFVITNTRKTTPTRPQPDTIDIEVIKIWEPAGQQHPESVTAVLYRDGARHRSVTLNAGNNWTWKWERLPENHNWTVDETGTPEGYEKAIASSNSDGLLSFVITNTKPPAPIDVEVTKVWESDGRRPPDSVEVQLYYESNDGNGEKVKYGDPVTLNEGNGWYKKWEGLPGDYKWTVDEPNVPSRYTKTISSSTSDGLVSFVIKNTYTYTPTPTTSPSPSPTPTTSPTPTPPRPTPTGPSDNGEDIYDPNIPGGGLDIPGGPGGQPGGPGGPGNIPKTGDDTDARPWLITLMVSTIILRYVLFNRKKSNNKTKERSQ